MQHVFCRRAHGLLSAFRSQMLMRGIDSTRMQTGEQTDILGNRLDTSCAVRVFRQLAACRDDFSHVAVQVLSGWGVHFSVFRFAIPGAITLHSVLSGNLAASV